jgi:phosphate uptake regulator
MGTLAIMGFAAEDNLRSVAQALGKGEPAALARVAERNAKQPRLRAEIEEQIVEELAQMPSGADASRKLLLASRVARLFESMGARTVEIAQLSAHVLCDLRPSRLADIRKLIEHAVYITDRAATGLVEEDLAMAKIARAQRTAANELHARIVRDLARLASERPEARPRVDLLSQVACKAHGLIEEAGRLADDVIACLEGAVA